MQGEFLATFVEGMFSRKLDRTAVEDYALCTVTTMAKDCLSEFKLQPLDGNVSVFRLKTHRQAASKSGNGRANQMTKEDWDKFEKDITDAFEQIP